MPITTEVDYDNQLTIFKVAGEPSFQESLETYMKFYAINPTQKVLWDCRMASFAQISNDEFKNIIYSIEPFKEKRNGGKTALLVSNDLEFGVSRMLKAQTEMNDFPIEIEVFKSMEEAIYWLGAD